MTTTHPPYVVLQKRRGETPLESLRAWRELHAEYAGLPAAYAGRLDPMAEGKLLVLLGEECKRQEKYFGLDKEYTIEVVLDLETDTGDALGIPTYTSKITLPTRTDLIPALRSVSGKHIVPYPAFSSKTVAGKPLFMHVLEGSINNIEIPKHTETIYRIALTGIEQLSTAELEKRLREALGRVPRSDEPSKLQGADFRQGSIRRAWRSLLHDMPDRHFAIVSLRVTCASGTYMRTLATRIASELGTSGFAFSINRTRLGRYRTLGPLGFWTREY